MDMKVPDSDVNRWHAELSKFFDGVVAHHAKRAVELASELSATQAKVQIVCEMYLEVRVDALPEGDFSDLVSSVRIEGHFRGREWQTFLLVRKKYEETLLWLKEREK